MVTQRLDALAVQGILAACGRLLEVAHSEPSSLHTGLGMEGEQVVPQAASLGAQRLALNHGGWGETTPGDEARNALGGRLLVGDAPSSPSHRRTQHTR
jgi:hypothetical protein